MQIPKLDSVLIVLHRVGPYHHARFQAAVSALPCPLVVLQTRPQSQEYPWSFVVEGAAYTLLSLEGGLSPEQDPPRPVLRHQLEQLLERYQPSAIVSVGWADRAYLQLMRLAQQRFVPLVVVSDSRRQDSARSPWKEWLKRQLIRGYSAGIVAGIQSRDYLRQLGMHAEAIQQPWDVIENDLFSKFAFDSENQAIPDRERPFLCVGRFIFEKNHALLLQAFSIYQSRGGKRSLLLIGHGPLEHEIRLACQQLPHPHAVRFIPFVQLEQLSQYYASSCALVLPSRKDTWGLVVNEAMASGLPVIVSDACGCVDDLISPDVTGWTFASGDPQQLAACLKNADNQTAEERSSMIQKALIRLHNYTPAKFAQALDLACTYAASNFRLSLRSRWISRLLLMLTP